MSFLDQQDLRTFLLRAKRGFPPLMGYPKNQEGKIIWALAAGVRAAGPQKTIYRGQIASATILRFPPNPKMDLKRRSRDTDLSAPSIFAIRD